MYVKNKCRVCLADEAKHTIFDDVESKESIHSKLFQCFKEKIDDIEGYPRKICETCLHQLDIVNSFISKYRTSCKLLETGLQIVKQEASDNDDVDYEYETIEMEYLKNEPEQDGLETLSNTMETIPLQCEKEKKNSKKSLTDIKAKLKTLSEINFKKRPRKKKSHNCKPSSKIASSIMEAEFQWSGERWCINSSKIKEPKEEKPKLQQREPKLVLPKPKVKPQPPRLCDLCGEIFKNNDRLSKHRQKVHFKNPMPCPECPKILANKIELNRHVKRRHSAVKAFVCDTCGYGFITRGEMLKHIQIVHLKVKKKKQFACKLCDKIYACAKSVLIHERSVHTGDRPAECKVCGSTFYHEEYLKEHMRLHTGEAPFKCPICGRGYAQRGNMKSHIAHNHRLADLDEETKKKFKPHWFKWLKAP